MVERELDLLQAIHEKNRAILAFSIQTTDDAIRARFEPGAAPIEERFRLLREAKARGIHTGVMAMPVLPGISDQPDAIDALLGRCADEGVDFVLCGGLTLRPGAQKDAYLAAIGHHHPDLLPGYEKVYASERPSGTADSRYYRRLEGRFHESLVRHGLPGRMPRAVFAGALPQYAEVAVLLEHREYALAREGKPAPWLGRSGMALQKWAKTELGALRRRRKPDAWQQVEQRFRDLVERDGLEGVDGLDARAVPEVQGLVAALPPPKGLAQLSLL
jgi:hypothetical protein